MYLHYINAIQPTVIQSLALLSSPNASSSAEQIGNAEIVQFACINYCSGALALGKRLHSKYFRAQPLGFSYIVGEWLVTSHAE